jgi:hypothetical protein
VPAQNTSFSTFPMCVPSLPWQIDQFYSISMAPKKGVFFRTSVTESGRHASLPLLPQSDFCVFVTPTSEKTSFF